MWCRTRSTTARPIRRATGRACDGRHRRDRRGSAFRWRPHSFFSRAIPRSAMIFSRHRRRAPGRIDYTFVTEFRRVGNCDISPNCRYFSIPERCRAPCKATAHRFQHDEIAALDSAVLDRRIERQRNRGRRSVGVLVDGDHDFFGRKRPVSSRSRRGFAHWPGAGRPSRHRRTVRPTSPRAPR